ncbi:hypothetical protein LTR04_000770 [Oleoguttula sp. CCFEE 6159]|nr:hypothetical protein LTR04_000770 [Oleoguttula sp. CCFEE 6159]
MARPPVSLTDKLANLHLLLRVKSFARWPLDVRFFAPDVWKMWGRWDERTAGRIREGIGIELVRPDGSVAAERLEAGAVKDLVQGNGVLEALDVGYASLKAYLEKSKAMLSTGEPVACTICERSIENASTLALVCPGDGCRMVSHVPCLSERFLAEAEEADAIVPIEGDCPGCKIRLRWMTLVKECSLRLRGQKEIDGLFKKRRVKKGEAEGDGWEDAVRLDQEGDNDDEDSGSEEEAGDIVVDYKDVKDNESDFIVPSGMHMVAAEEGSQHRGDWIRRANDLNYSDDTMSTRSGARDDVGYFSATGTHHVGQRQGLIIEDSDWDDAEVLD